PAIAAESPEAKTPVGASGQERRRSSLPAVAPTAFLAEDLQRKARKAPKNKISRIWTQNHKRYYVWDIIIGLEFLS
ncbi:MAG: hypothetical protein EA358_00800, partial [Flavobacteriales bacterium]